MNTTDDDKLRLDGITEEVRKFLLDYMTILELKRRVEERLKEFERQRQHAKHHRKKIRHGISGLRSTLRNLDHRREVIVRTLEARIARSVGVVDIQNIKIVPKHLAQDGKCGRYYITELQNINVELKTPIILIIEIPTLEVDKAEQLLYIINEIFRIFSKLGLSIILDLKRLKMEDSEYGTAIELLKRSGFNIQERSREKVRNVVIYYNPEEVNL